MRKGRLRWIAPGLVALALLGVLAGWPGPRAMRAPAPASPQGTTKPRTPPQPAAGDTRRGPASDATATAPEEALIAACSRDYQRELRALRTQLGPPRTADDALDRLVLDTLTSTPADWASGAIARRSHAARRRWPNDVDVAWVSVAWCSDGCDRNAEVEHLLAVDPDNAAAWMAAMATARGRDDTTAQAYALQRAAAASFYDPRVGTVFLRARSLLASRPVPDSCTTPAALASLHHELGRPATPDDLADLMANAIEMAMIAPPYLALSDCMAQDTPLPRQPCIALLSRVAQGDTLLEQSIALRGLIALETGTAQDAQLRERYRRVRWLAMHPPRPLPEHFAARMRSEGEVALLQALAVQRHAWPPPAD